MALMDARKTKFYNYIDQSDNKIKLKALSLTSKKRKKTKNLQPISCTKRVRSEKRTILMEFDILENDKEPLYQINDDSPSYTKRRTLRNQKLAKKSSLTEK